MKREWYGAEMFAGHLACKACGKWDNRCGNRIVMIEKEDAQCSKN